MKKTIKLNDVDPMMFAGANDQNMKVILNNFESNIVLRGNQLHLNGSVNEIKAIELLINDIIYTINNKGHIDSSDLEILINTNTNSLRNIKSNDNIILHTHSGTVTAQTLGQRKYYKAVLNNDIVFVIGPAGTGKTYQAVACAVSALKNKEVEKIIITRPVVEAGERLGFLPGDLKDKVDPYLTPLYDALNKMLKRDKIKKYIDTKVLKLPP